MLSDRRKSEFFENTMFLDTWECNEVVICSSNYIENLKVLELGP